MVLIKKIKDCIRAKNIKGRILGLILGGIGELILIIFGVWIGITWANSNDKENENEFTKELIFELNENLKTNLKSLKLNQRRERQNLELNYELIHLIDSKGNCKDFPSDGLKKDNPYAGFKSITHFDQVNLEKSAYNTFKSFGFSNIDSPELRSKLINLYEQVYPGHIDKPYEISKSRYESVSLNVINRNFFYNVKSKSWKPYSCDSLFSDKEYKSLVTFEIEYREWRLSDAETAIQSTEDLSKVVDSVLLTF